MFTEHSYNPINSSNIVKTWSDQLGILGIETEKKWNIHILVQKEVVFHYLYSSQ